MSVWVRVRNADDGSDPGRSEMFLSVPELGAEIAVAQDGRWHIWTVVGVRHWPALLGIDPSVTIEIRDSGQLDRGSAPDGR